MIKISTENLQNLPKPIEFKKLCKSISALDAIICPEWEFRYYSYQKNWSNLEEFCEMRNGQGDQMLILFREDGTCINGFAHESKLNGWENGTQKIAKGILEKLPNQFNEFIFGEPVKSIGTTFCIWNSDSTNDWKTGQIELPNDDYKDGSEDLLSLLNGNPMSYKNWAENYYEEEFENRKLKIELVEEIYKGNIITTEMCTQINPNIKDFDQLKTDFEEIGYQHEI